MKKQFYAILIAGITAMMATGFVQAEVLTWDISVSARQNRHVIATLNTGDSTLVISCETGTGNPSVRDGLMIDYGGDVNDTLHFRPYINQIKTVIIETGVKNIGNRAFTQAWNQNTYKSIMPAITSVSIGDSVQIIGRQAFYLCSDLTSISFGANVTTIEDEAFYGCWELAAINLPNSLTTIGNRAFRTCHFSTIDIPASVISIGTNAFSSVVPITAINVDSENPNYASEDGILFNKDKTTLIQYPTGKEGSAYTIPDNIINVEIDAFSDCWGLTLIIPNHLTDIDFARTCGEIVVYADNPQFSSENGVLFNKDKSTLIIYPKGKQNQSTSYSIPESVDTIGYRAFEACSKLTSIHIPNSVTMIGESAFGGCMRLTSVRIPGSVETIGDRAFANCTDLMTLEIENGVKTIGESAFESRDTGRKLTSVSIPNSVTSIGAMAFQLQTALDAVTIGNNVESIGSGAFSYCYNLAEIHNKRTVPQSITNYTFQRVDTLACVLYVPKGSLQAYREADVWKSFAHIEEEAAIAEATQNTVTIEWYPVDNAVSYALIIYADAEKTRIIAVINIPATAAQNSKLRSITANIFSCTVEDLQPNTAYWYDIEAKDEEGQTFETVSGNFSTQATSNINELKLSEIDIFPNPAKDEISIQSDLVIKKIEILDLSGRNVATIVGARLIAPLQGGVQTINVSKLPAGVYLLKINTGKQLITKKFVKE